MQKLVMICMLWLACMPVMKATDGEKAVKEASKVKRVLVVGLKENVSSNYFIKQMISEETGIAKDSIDYQYNRVVAEGIASAIDEKNNTVLFIPDAHMLQGATKGEETKMHTDIVSVDAAQWSELVTASRADYVLVLDQHFLDWREKPLRTLFHYINYSLYNATDKAEKASGNVYFTTMEPDDTQELRKNSRKALNKLTASVSKVINKTK